MGVTPIDIALIAHQRSDISKVAGDEFLKVQQQQLASVIQEEEEAHKNETKKLEMDSGVAINPDEDHEKHQNDKNHLGGNKQTDEEDGTVVEDNVEYVEYDDPDVGHVIDWQG